MQRLPGWPLPLAMHPSQFLFPPALLPIMFKVLGLDHTDAIETWARSPSRSEEQGGIIRPERPVWMLRPRGVVRSGLFHLRDL